MYQHSDFLLSIKKTKVNIFARPTPALTNILA
jgi:hypothetical protein